MPQQEVTTKENANIKWKHQNRMDVKFINSPYRIKQVNLSLLMTNQSLSAILLLIHLKSDC